MAKPSKPRRVPLLWILLPYALGIGIARFVALPHPLLLLTISLGAIATASALSAKRSIYWHAPFVLALTLVGAARFDATTKPLGIELPEVPREAELQLEIISLFNATDPQTALGIARVVQSPPQQEDLRGQKIFYFLDLPETYSYPKEGETHRTIGVVRQLPTYDEGDRFDAYLRNQNLAMSYKQGYFLEKTKAAHGFEALTNATKQKLAQVLSRNKVPESPLTGAYKGIMLGQKSELTSEQKQLFLANGTMHLFAISGLHIGVIAVCCHQLLSILRFKGASRALLALTAVGSFVIVTGGSPSSWRALLMVACFYLATFTRKQTAPVNALAVSALIYLVLQPTQLFQAGFQMSYLTVSAILLLGLPLARTLNQSLPLFSHIPASVRSWNQKSLVVFKSWLLDALGVSIAAFLVSAILGIYYFQTLPSYGVLINLIALPIASLAIVAGFISLLVSPLLPVIPLSVLFNNAAIVLIKLVHYFLEQTSLFPLATVTTSPIPAWTAAVATLSTLFLIAVAYSKSANVNYIYWLVASIALPVVWIVLLQSPPSI